MTRPKGIKETSPRVPVTAEIMEIVADHLGEGWSLRQICALDGMPTPGAIVRAARREEDLGVIYRRGRQDQLAFWAEELVDIADNAQNDWMERESGPAVNGEAINRSRLRVDTRKWLLSKLRPSDYGDKTTVEHTGSVDVSMPDEELNRRIVEKLMAQGLGAEQIRAMGYEVPEDGDRDGA